MIRSVCVLAVAATVVVMGGPVAAQITDIVGSDGTVSYGGGDGNPWMAAGVACRRDSAFRSEMSVHSAMQVLFFQSGGKLT